METPNEKKLFEDFQEVDKKTWKAQVVKDLKGKDYDENLVWNTQEGFDVQPFYTGEDAAELGYIQCNQNLSVDPTFATKQWENRVKIAAKDFKKANQEALEVLQNGADSILFVLEGSIDEQGLQVLLKDILLQYCAVSFIGATEPASLAKYFAAFAQAQDAPAETVKGGIITPMANFSAGQAAQVAQALEALPTYQGIVLEAPTAEAKKDILGAVLKDAKLAIDQMIDGGVQPALAVAQIGFQLHAGNDFFMEVAAIRALRMLFCKMALQYGVETYKPDMLKISVFTTIAIDETTKEDPYLNMLSNSSQAMSAIAGGCDALCVLPHNEGLEEVDGFSKRIARNVSTILKEEAYFDKVADPAAGSYYIEYLTDKIARLAWTQFQELL